MGNFILETRAVLDEGLFYVKVAVEDGIIKNIEKLQTSYSNLIAFPGFIDVHVHAREYPLPRNPDSDQVASWKKMTSKETFLTAGLAAINGGVVLYGAMPNDPIPPDNPETYNLKINAAKTSACPVFIMACVTKNSEPWADIPYKLYLDHKPGPTSFAYWDDVETVLGRYSGRHVFFHAEDPVILEQKSHLAQRWQNRPPEAEINAVRKILDIAAKTGIRPHICHISTIESVKLIEDFNRTSSVKVTSEVTPHHLFFSVGDSGVLGDGAVVLINRSFFDCNPPLRSETQRREILEALRDGLIDMVAGDHAPHTLEDKSMGAPGMPQLDTYGPFAAWLIKDRSFCPESVARIFSTAPAGLISNYVDGHYGNLKRGEKANMTILDMSGQTLVDGSRILGKGPLQTRCGWSPFEGITLPGAVHKVLIDGGSIDG